MEDEERDKNEFEEDFVHFWENSDSPEELTK